MIKKKLLILGIAGAISLGMTTGVFATPVPVSYDNTKEIGLPIDPTWAIQIPTAVEFTNDIKSVDTSVKLVAKGGTLPVGIKAEVSVLSANQYKMIHTDKKTDINYTLQYDGQSALTGSAANKIATLELNKEVHTGTATMNGVAKLRGEYTDTLTYSVIRVDLIP